MSNVSERTRDVKRLPESLEAGKKTVPRRRKRRETLAAWGFLLPDLTGLGIFVVLPMVLAVVVSLFSVSGFGDYAFIGLTNFQRMGADPLLPQALRVTFLYSLLYVPLAYVVSLGLALLVQKRFPGVGLIRTAFFIPYVLSLVVVAIIWQFLLADRSGLIPLVLRPFGLGTVSWLGDPRIALLTVVLVSVWSQAGYQMLIFLGGLGDIPKEYYDAASIDGAGFWQKLSKVTLPLLRPTSFFILVTSALGAVAGMQAFDLIFVMTQGGPANSTMTMPFYIYQQAFTYNDLGYASALTSLLVAVLVVAVAFTFRLTRGARFDD